MKFTTTVAALFAFAASVSAQGISVINPISGAQWKAGTTQTITWTVTNATTITGIVLRQGDALNLGTVYTISSEQLDASVQQYQWTIAPTTAAGADYSVAVDTELGQQYSPYFTILAADVASSSAPVQSSAAPISSGAASSAAPVSSASAASSRAPSSVPVSTKVAPSASVSATPSAPATGAASNMKANVVLGVAAAGAVLALF